mgnify:CR=1 FL=1
MKERVAVILGPTATGKSYCAIELAKRLNGEIISGDSMYVYRGMDIGTAKPTAEELAEVPHHLVDILPADAKFDVVDFKERAEFLIKDINARGKLPIIAGGTGNPYFTTDTASVLRAIELKADVMMKGTRVDGIYNADPEKDPTATKYTQITYDEILDMKLKVMDLTAITMCRENNMPIYVFDMDTIGNLEKVMNGQQIGTLVKP